MSKPNRDTQRRRGEERLKEWGVAGDAGVAALRAVTGRDAAADLAVAERLGAHVEAAAVAALLALESASKDKLVRKEVRRSLYRLQQRGLEIPHAPAPPPPTLIAGPALEGYLSAVDGRGDQLVWLVKPRPAGVAHLFAVVNDPDGLREVELTETTRKALRAARQEMLSRHEIRMVEADWRYCDFLIDRAFRWATEKGHPISGDYRGVRAQLLKEPAHEMPAPIRSRVDVEAVRSDPQLVVDSAALLEEKELRTWFFGPDDLKRYLDEVQQIKDSPLVLNQVQQQERVRAVVDRAVEEIFGGAMQSSWVRRLESMAYFFDVTGRPEQAQRALAAALALESSTHGGRDIALCETLARSGLAAFLQVEEQRQHEEARSSLVVTPQQAAREAQRRR